MLLFFHKDETITARNLSHDMPQSMGYSYVQNRKPAVTGHSEWPTLGTSTVDEDMEQLFWASATSYRTSHVFLHMCKRLSTLNFDFSRKVKEVLWQKFNLFAMYRKTKLGNPP